MDGDSCEAIAAGRATASKPCIPTEIKTTRGSDLRRGTEIRTTRGFAFRRGTDMKTTRGFDLRRGTDIRTTRGSDLRRGTDIKTTRWEWSLFLDIGDTQEGSAHGSTVGWPSLEVFTLFRLLLYRCKQRPAW